jgi:glucosamine-6-phosphate deaminase
MDFKIFDDRNTLGRAAADQAAAAIRKAIREDGKARIVAATAASQKEFLEALTSAPEIQWLNVEAFHPEEYIGLPMTHPGCRKMLLQSATYAYGNGSDLLTGTALVSGQLLA